MKAIKFQWKKMKRNLGKKRKILCFLSLRIFFSPWEIRAKPSLDLFINFFSPEKLGQNLVGRKSETQKKDGMALSLSNLFFQPYDVKEVHMTVLFPECYPRERMILKLSKDQQLPDTLRR